MLVKSLLPVFLLAARVYSQDAAAEDTAPAVFEGADTPSSEGEAVPSPAGDSAPEAEPSAPSSGSGSGSSSSSASAEVGVTPNEPSGRTVAKVGDKIKIQWDAGATWTNMTIQLKTGANQVMKGLTVVAEGVDATKSNAYEWTVPDVNPYSQIYFFELLVPVPYLAIDMPELTASTNNGPDLQPATWTTRFTIASPNGETTPPPKTETAGSSLIGWGIGALATGAPAPGVAGGASATPTGPSRLGASGSATPDAAVNAGVSANDASATGSASGSGSASKKDATATTKPSGSASPAPSSGAGKLVPGAVLALAAVAFFA
ncbi:hypothetical protein A1Q1_03764 [Trichosporon asahii var. asahii CBS 2479]|uniref:Yeast cell wall synthesis Kre9/Knh1-like N-terminal domain-containing protein n=1 Tax=Trichosporon asahii var. asahii (strain ATCC 90039 / CBS 2479 / JCM 2466 / KCTC 7840 / NBRC 103889/ NCYC 2677 / UAMH 7654) TaxID=1186058 RepID=J5STB4_TRIAS|nr:hypothetical protein A1Q1_03764 [Trichosporon asahii var. asahii CBS 2479]EJT47426.1 hypothetical protein A1Q1_03764 [Trichosporon asahii var. asahii CBS 2479]